MTFSLSKGGRNLLQTVTTTSYSPLLPSEKITSYSQNDLTHRILGLDIYVQIPTLKHQHVFPFPVFSVQTFFILFSIVSKFTLKTAFFIPILYTGYMILRMYNYVVICERVGANH